MRWNSARSSTPSPSTSPPNAPPISHHQDHNHISPPPTPTHPSSSSSPPHPTPTHFFSDDEDEQDYTCDHHFDDDLSYSSNHHYPPTTSSSVSPPPTPSPSISTSNPPLDSSNGRHHHPHNSSSSSVPPSDGSEEWRVQNAQSTCEFTHTITHYSSKRESGCKKAEYSATTVDGYGNRWRLIVYVNGNGRASNHHLSLFLQVADADELPFGWKKAVSYVLTLEHPSGPSLGYAKRNPDKTFKLCPKAIDWGWSQFITSDRIQQEGYVSNDSLTVRASVTVKSSSVSIDPEDAELYLKCAVEEGNPSAVTACLSQGAHVNCQFKDDLYTPLHTACSSSTSSGSLDVLKLLLDRGADGNACNKWRETPLLIAANNGHRAAVAALLEYGADPSLCSEAGWSALTFAAHKGYDDIVSLLLASGAPVNCKVTEDLSTPLHKACAGGKPGHLSAVQQLLRGGADVHAMNKWRETPLLTAANHGQAAAVEALLRSGADPCKCTDTGWSPLSIAAYKGHDDVVRLLLEEGAPTEEADPTLSALLQAATKGLPDTVELLLRHGADHTVTTKKGDTALSILVEQNLIDAAVEMVMEYKASVPRCSRDRKKVQRARLLINLRVKQQQKEGLLGMGEDDEEDDSEQDESDDDGGKDALHRDGEIPKPVAPDKKKKKKKKKAKSRESAEAKARAAEEALLQMIDQQESQKRDEEAAANKKSAKKKKRRERERQQRLKEEKEREKLEKEKEEKEREERERLEKEKEAQEERERLKMKREKEQKEREMKEQLDNERAAVAAQMMKKKEKDEKERRMQQQQQQRDMDRRDLKKSITSPSSAFKQHLNNRTGGLSSATKNKNATGKQTQRSQSSTTSDNNHNHLGHGSTNHINTTNLAPGSSDHHNHKSSFKQPSKSPPGKRRGWETKTTPISSPKPIPPNARVKQQQPNHQPSPSIPQQQRPQPPQPQIQPSQPSPSPFQPPNPPPFSVETQLEDISHEVVDFLGFDSPPSTTTPPILHPTTTYPPSPTPALFSPPHQHPTELPSVAIYQHSKLKSLLSRFSSATQISLTTIKTVIYRYMIRASHNNSQYLDPVIPSWIEEDMLVSFLQRQLISECHVKNTGIMTIEMLKDAGSVLAELCMSEAKDVSQFREGAMGEEEGEERDRWSDATMGITATEIIRGRDRSVVLDYAGRDRVYLPLELFQRLKHRHVGYANRFLSHVFAMVKRYETRKMVTDGTEMGRSLGRLTLDVLGRECGVTMEGHADPLGVEMPRFFGMFEDVDEVFGAGAPFGGERAMSALGRSGGSVVVLAPLEASTRLLYLQTILSLLEETGEGGVPLSFHLFLRDVDGADRLDPRLRESGFMRAVERLEPNGHYFAGVSQPSSVTTSTSDGSFGAEVEPSLTSSLYVVLQNAAGREIFAVSDAVLERVARSLVPNAQRNWMAGTTGPTQTGGGGAVGGGVVGRRRLFELEDCDGEEEVGDVVSEIINLNFLEGEDMEEVDIEAISLMGIEGGFKGRVV